MGDTYFINQARIRNNKGKNGRKQTYSSRYALTGVSKCGGCSESYRRIYWKDRGFVWRCISRLDKRNRDCRGRTVDEQKLHSGIARAITQVLVDKEKFLKQLQENIDSVLSKSLTKQKVATQSKLTKLQKQIVTKATGGDDYDDLARQIISLQKANEKIDSELAELANKQRRVKELTEFLDGQDAVIEYSDVLVRRLIDQITVNDDGIEVEFKSGISVKVAI